MFPGSDAWMGTCFLEVMNPTFKLTIYSKTFSVIMGGNLLFLEGLGMESINLGILSTVN